MKKRILAVFLSISLLLLMATAAQAAPIVTKPINASYQNIQIYINGNTVKIPVNEEPFIFNGRTFVPIRLVAETLNFNVEWLNDLKAVKITGAAADTSKDKEIESLKLQLTQKNQEITTLKNTIASLQKKAVDLGDLEDDLISEFDYLEDVEIDDLILDGDEDSVEVTIEVNLDDYSNEWEDLTDKDIKNWLEDLTDYIQDELSEDTGITGEIVDIDSDDVLIEFEKDGDDNLDVQFEDEDYREGSSASDAEDVEESLEGEYFYVGNIEFELTVADYDDKDELVEVELEALDDDALDSWFDLNDNTIEDDVIDICDEIAEIFEDDADINLETVIIYFYDEYGDLIESFDYNVDDQELD